MRVCAIVAVLPALAVAAWAVCFIRLCWGIVSTGVAESPTTTPVVGRSLGELGARGPTAFEHVHHYRGHQVAVSGAIEAESLKRFCETHRLLWISSSGQHVELADALRRPDPEHFVTTFPPGHAEADGVVDGYAQVRLYYRHADQRFLAFFTVDR
jgi:hypothetical protein